MKIYSQYEETVKREKLESLSCDICKKEARKGGCWASDISKVIVSLEEGISYGQDGGNSKEIEFDICPDCFKEKIIPFVKLCGGNEPRITERDW